MKIHSLVLACIGFISIATHSSSCLAGNRAGALTTTVAGGYQYFAAKRSVNNTRLGIVMLGYDFTEHWGIEGLLGGLHTRFKKRTEDNRQINGTIFAIDGVYHFTPTNRLEPYVLAGAGVIGLNPTKTNANNEGNINAALGVQLFVHKSLAVRFEARDFYTMVGGKNDVLLNAGVSLLIDMC